MIYILGINLKKQKSLQFSLVNIYGLNKRTTLKICRKLGYSNTIKLKNLTKDQLLHLTFFLENLNLEILNKLKKSKDLCIKNLIHIKSFRGLRLIKGLPVRGQRTRTNAKTCYKKPQNTY